VLKAGHDNELQVKQRFQHCFLCWCLSGSPEVKHRTAISKRKMVGGQIFLADPWPLKTAKYQKPLKDLCILGLAFLFSSEEENHSGPDVLHGHPNELENTSIPKGNRLLQISIAEGRRRVSNS